MSRHETKRFISINLAMFAAGAFCNLYADRPQYFKEILAGLALSQDTYSDLHAILVARIQEQEPGLVHGLSSLGLVPCELVSESFRQAAWVSLANVHLFTRPKTLEQVAAASLKLKALLRQEMTELLDKTCSRFATSRTAPRPTRPPLGETKTSWTRLFKSQLIKSEFDLLVEADKKLESPGATQTQIPDFLKPTKQTGLAKLPRKSDFKFDLSKSN
jgi:hypothetical protein